LGQNKTNANAFVAYMLFISKQALVPTDANFGSYVYLQTFTKQVGTWSASVLWLFTRSCSCQDDCGIHYACAVLDWKIAQQHTSWEISVVIIASFFQNAHCIWSKSLTARVHEMYSMGFIVALDVDETFMDSWIAFIYAS